MDPSGRVGSPSSSKMMGVGGGGEPIADRFEEDPPAPPPEPPSCDRRGEEPEALEDVRDRPACPMAVAAAFEGEEVEGSDTEPRLLPSAAAPGRIVSPW